MITVRFVSFVFLTATLLFSYVSFSLEPERPQENLRPEINNDYGLTPLHQAVLDTNLPLLQRLRERGEDIEATNIGKQTALHLAAIVGNKEIIKQLIKYKANIEAQSDYGLTPLHHAAERNQKECSEILLLKGANLKAKTDLGRTPCDLAFNRNHETLVVFFNQWPRKAHRERMKNLKTLEKQLKQPHGFLLSLFQINYPCSIIASFLTIKETLAVLNN